MILHLYERSTLENKPLPLSQMKSIMRLPSLFAKFQCLNVAFAIFAFSDMLRYFARVSRILPRAISCLNMFP